MRRFVALLLSITLFHLACADIAVRPMALYFQADRSPYKDVWINNLGDKPAYVDIQAVQLINPGTQNESIKTVKDPKNFGLLVTPIRAKIEGKQAKSIRVSLLQPGGNVERDYRLWIRPMPVQVKAVNKPTSPQVYLQVLTAYYVYVYVLPKEIHPKVAVEQSGKQIIVKNTGNVVVELRDGKQCVDQKKCVLLPKKTLYPNSTWTLRSENDGKASFDVYVAQAHVALLGGG